MQPLSLETLATSDSWGGYDGQWYTFTITVGTPRQFVKVVPSTSSAGIYLVSPQGCPYDDPRTCSLLETNSFDSSKSTTWQLGKDGCLPWMAFNETASSPVPCGYDNAFLETPGTNSTPVATPLITLENQTFGILNLTEDNIGMIGLLPGSVSTNGNQNSSSSKSGLLQSLKAAGHIPSLSWSYTAGSWDVYVNSNDNSGEASLTLGGYDAARFVPNNMTFAIKNSSVLSMTLRRISVGEGGEKGSIPVETNSVVLDSSTSHFWFDVDICEWIAGQYNLIYNQELNLYLVNETAYPNLRAANMSLNFMLSSEDMNEDSPPYVSVELPYPSLDFTLPEEWPGNTNGSIKYFPLRQTTKTHPNTTLGRTFFQNAYVIVDYERSTFSVNQATFPPWGTQDISAISPVPGFGIDNATAIGSASPTGPDTASGSSSTTGKTGPSSEIIAASVSGVVGLLVAIIAMGLFIWHQKKRERQRPDFAKAELEDQPVSRHENAELDAGGSAMPELRGDTNHPSELRGTNRPDELVAEEVAGELKADIPTPHEMKGSIPTTYEMEA